MHLLGQPVAARLRLVHRLHQLFEGDLARRMLEALRREPKPMFAGPMRAIGIDASLSQKEARHLLARAPQRLHRHLPRAAKIAHHLVGVLRNPDRREFARTEQRGLRKRVAPIGFHPIARPRRNQRRRDDHAFMTERRDLSIKPIAARPRLITKRQRAVLLGQAVDHLCDRFRSAWDLADKARFFASPGLGDRHRNRLLMRINRHIGRRRLFHGSFPMHEALTDSSANPHCRMPWNEPP